jgi:hypothetical protein
VSRTTTSPWGWPAPPPKIHPIYFAAPLPRARPQTPQALQDGMLAAVLRLLDPVNRVRTFDVTLTTAA